MLLLRDVAPPKVKQASVGTAPAVVGFRQLLRPALPDSRQPQVWRVWGEVAGVGGGDALGSTDQKAILKPRRPK